MKRNIFLVLGIVLLSINLFSCSNNEKKVEIKTSTDSVKQENVLILDVRTTDEWINDGHADCATNIPLDQLESNIDKIKSYDKVVVVCRSGNRAGSAKDFLNEKGIVNIENAGAWQNIDCK